MDDKKIAVVYPTIIIGSAFLCGIIFCIFVGSVGYDYGAGVYVGMFILGAIIGGLLGVLIWILVYNIAEKNHAKEQMQTQLRLISSGKWEFPIDAFYEKCVSEKATAVTNKLNFKKMMLIAKNIIDTEGIPQEYAHLYYDEEKVKYYFKAGKENSQTAKKKAAEEEKLRKITPQEAKLTDEMKEIRNLHFALRNELYAAKRKLHLEILIGSIEKKIQSYKKAFDNTLTVAAAMSSSAKQTPKNDWAVIGGFVQGIAGPAAGAIAASQAIAENEKIEYENRQNKSAVEKRAFSMAKSASDGYIHKKGELEKIQKPYKDALEKLPLKLFFEEYDKNELFNSLKISGSVSKPNNESVTVTIDIFNGYNPEIKNYTVVMDGIIKTKLYCEDIFVDEFFIALPANGIAYNEKAVIIQYPKKYMIGENRKYRFEFSPHSLWLMER